MNRLQLEHIIRSAGIIALSENVIIIGSQAILGEHPDAPSELLMSMEADVIIPKNQEAWNLIDGVLGEQSAFHETHGYYADGVDETTAILSSNWKKRLIKVCNPIQMELLAYVWSLMILHHQSVCRKRKRY